MLRIMAELFHDESEQLDDAGIFKAIGAYNELLVKLKKFVDFEEMPEEEEEDPEKKQIVLIVPDTITPPAAALKQMTASKILQIVGKQLAPQVTECITETLLLELTVPVENGTQLPWKPSLFRNFIDLFHWLKIGNWKFHLRRNLSYDFTNSPRIKYLYQ